MATLHLDADATRLSTDPTDPTDQKDLRIAPGLDELRSQQLTGPASLALGIELAIAMIEDELARVPKALHGLRLHSSSSVLREMAYAAGLAASVTELHREAVEQVFARQAAFALWRAAGSPQAPDDTSFIAAVLIVRELMHHLDIASITLTG